MQSRGWGPSRACTDSDPRFALFCGGGLASTAATRMSCRAQGVRRLTHYGAVTNRRARCAFCFAESADFPVLTRELLVSRPVASAFGIDRTSPFLRTDPKLEDMRWTTVNGVSRKVVCAACNNGWMNVLEHEMSEVARWMDGDVEQALGDHRERILRAWMTKTHVLLCFIEGDAGRFGDSGFHRAVVPPVSLARALFERRYDDLAELGLGLARSESDTDFALREHPAESQRVLRSQTLVGLIRCPPRDAAGSGALPHRTSAGAAGGIHIAGPTPGWSQEWSQEPARGHGDQRMSTDVIMSLTCGYADRS